MDAMVDGMHKGIGQQVYCVRVNTFTNLMDVVLLWLLLPRWGIAGYFFTFTLTHLLNFYLSIARLMTITGYTPPLSFILKILLCALAAALLTGAISPLVAAPLSACLIGTLIYLISFALLVSLTSSLTAADIAWLRSVLRIGKIH